MARNYNNTSDSRGGSRGEKGSRRDVDPGAQKRDVARRAPTTSIKKSSTSSSSASSSNTQPQQQSIMMQAAVAEALFPEGGRRRTMKGSDSVDEYGKGSPTDRLQFGYAPTIAEEAVCFHARVPASEWIQDRKRIGKIVFAKHQKNPVMHFEPISSALKLRDHWKKQSVIQANYRADGAPRGALDAEKYEGLLELFASKQRLA